MAGNHVRNGCDRAYPYHLLIAERLHVFDRRKAVERLPESELWVVRRVLAALKRLRRRRAGGHSRAGVSLDRADAAAVVEMAVRYENQLDVLGLESKRADVVDDQWRRLAEAGIEQDVPGLARHEQG